LITENDLKEAIAKCNGVSKPNETAYILYAAATYLLDRAKKEQSDNKTLYSYANAQMQEVVDYYADTDLSRAIDGKNAADVWDVIEEVFEAVHKIAPRLYEAAIQKLDEI
jgi:hypothetical protein